MSIISKATDVSCINELPTIEHMGALSVNLKLCSICVEASDASCIVRGSVDACTTDASHIDSEASNGPKTLADMNMSTFNGMPTTPLLPNDMGSGPIVLGLIVEG